MFRRLPADRAFRLARVKFSAASNASIPRPGQLQLCPTASRCPASGCRGGGGKGRGASLREPFSPSNRGQSPMEPPPSFQRHSCLLGVPSSRLPKTVTCQLLNTCSCCVATRFGRDDECAGCCHHLFQRMTIVIRQRSIRRKICPRDQSLLEILKSKLSQPLQYTLRHSLLLIRNMRKVSDSHFNIV